MVEEQEATNSVEETNDVMEHDQFKALKEENDSLRAENEEQEDRIKRLIAEFDNFKKRSAKEREQLYNSIISDIAISLLPVLDNLEKAVSVKTEDENYRVGVELVLKQFKEVLANNGVKEIEAVGKTFDPELHEAVSSVEDPDLGVQEIKEEYRKGYMIGNKVIRHSLVVVAN
jgi:molecular chaperone GrpE